MRRYIVEYGSSQWGGGTIESTSRDATRHGRELLGTPTDGWVKVWTTQRNPTDPPVSAALYTPAAGGYWYNCFPGYSASDWP